MMTEDQHDLVDFINQEIDKWDDERRYVRVLEIALAALTQPASPALKLPDGWKLVPVEPTEDMLVNGFESKPDERFSEPKVWAEYDAMSGCQQAAQRALLCWQAMLLAVPAVPHTAPIEPICATGGAEWVKPVPRELKQVLLELRTYNSKADEHGGKHIIPGWADRIEKALGIKPSAQEEA